MIKNKSYVYSYSHMFLLASKYMGSPCMIFLLLWNMRTNIALKKVRRIMTISDDSFVQGPPNQQGLKLDCLNQSWSVNPLSKKTAF